MLETCSNLELQGLLQCVRSRCRIPSPAPFHDHVSDCSDVILSILASPTWFSPFSPTWFTLARFLHLDSCDSEIYRRHRDSHRFSLLQLDSQPFSVLRRDSHLAPTLFASTFFSGEVIMYTNFRDKTEVNDQFFDKTDDWIIANYYCSKNFTWLNHCNDWIIGICDILLLQL